MSCEWGRTDCLNDGKKCHLCPTPDYHYQTSAKKRPQPIAKSSSSVSARKGSDFEARSHVGTVDMLTNVSARMTPNSGAGSIKGDEEIRGIINVMEELKQQTNVLASGDKTFSLKKSWLEKLNKEAQEAYKEFWYLRGSFGETNDFPFIVVEPDIIEGMVHTMIEDRKAKKVAEAELLVAKNRSRLLETELVKAQAEIELLKSQLRLQEIKEETF